ncbi:zinc metalloprotease [Metabacillus arenae]|uniref:Peptidase M50 domain-containing protein n=1 Tax=Metabacillus arenae TaxID=2771434 RepID=A0A926NE19_9BACI|nr:hypothetical protein [Metabacillus arenae]MBD1379526.1 hypothetical protein [Metabacillus arenae]
MFGLFDFISLILSVFIILPIVSIIHETGHLFFAYLFKAKNHKLEIGCGKPLFEVGRIRIRRFYFWYSWCQFEQLKRNSRIHYILVYAGPMIFNIVAAFLVNGLVYLKVLEESKFWNQFIYYSIFFVIFDILPMRYPDGQPSNGLVIYEMIRYGKKATFQKEKWGRTNYYC